jgi:hypothetical protein
VAVLDDFCPGELSPNIERPNDHEALEHGEDIVAELESRPARLSSEIAAMGI